jgi:broad specificity phosphatase PhoE
MVTIVFEAHSTSLDNENHVSSGHNDVALSELGLKQSKELGERYKNDHFDTIFCSDLQRSYKTAQLAFGDLYQIIRDPRLRECDYGDFAQEPSSVVEPEKAKRITEPFPNGESYEQTTKRMRNFLTDLLKNYDNKRVMIIGHRATQYGLEYWIKKIPLQKAVTAPWKWQPGWTYELEHLAE